MTTGVIIWLVLFAISAAGFLLIAAVVTVRGFVDMKMLLSETKSATESADVDRDEPV